ncbi:Aspartate aminotransferase [uncultured archaeon]|nr:Aspartate aminotransferase [uncultured archaeon]
MIPLTVTSFNEDEKNELMDCLNKNWVTMGEKTKIFETEFARYCGVEHALMTNNGTSALHIVLNAHGIHEGDEVIVPSLTFLSTAAAVSYCCAKPVFVDVERDTYCIDPESIEKNITNKTKAIVPVHLYGHPADMQAIQEIAAQHNLFVVEDAAEAHGAMINEKKVGSFGDAAIFSFFGNKIITTGEGGMVVTDDEQLYEKLKIIRNQGMDPNRKYWHPYLGFNYRPTDIQAALGIAQLRKIDSIIEKKRKIAKHYDKILEEIHGITRHYERKGYKSVYWMYSPLLRSGILVEDLIKKLREDGVDSRPFFPCLHWQPVYKEEKYLPVAEELSRTGINLPSGPSMTEKDIEFVIETVVKNIQDS